MPSMSKVELYAAIRRESRAGVSGRAIERKYNVGWRTVQKALTSAWPPERKGYPQRSSKLDPFTPVIDAMLREDLRAPRKQRHTVTRIYGRLIDEHGMTDVSYPVVRAWPGRPSGPTTCGFPATSCAPSTPGRRPLRAGDDQHAR